MIALFHPLIIFAYFFKFKNFNSSITIWFFEYMFLHFLLDKRNWTPVFRSLLDLVFTVLLFAVFPRNATPANNEGRLYFTLSFLFFLTHMRTHTHLHTYWIILLAAEGRGFDSHSGQHKTLTFRLYKSCFRNFNCLLLLIGPLYDLYFC